VLKIESETEEMSECREDKNVDGECVSVGQCRPEVSCGSHGQGEEKCMRDRGVEQDNGA